MITLYGIRNCDQVRKARAWLVARGIEHVVHDYKLAGVDGDRLRRWVDQVGWERLLNRAGTTFRTLPDADRDGLDAVRATALMLAHPSAIRRPVVDAEGVLLVGFDADGWARAIG